MKDDLRVVHPPSEASDWHVSADWSRLDDLCDGVFDCPHTTPQLSPVGPFVARSQDIRSGVFRLDQAGRVSEETYSERIERAEPRYGDLLFSREGTYFGIAAEVPAQVRVCLGQRMVLIRPKSPLLNFRFLRYWINSPTMASHISSFKDGSVAERLNMPTIRSLPVPDISLERQESIVRVLGALDDKIDLNNRINRNLEEIARATFNDWFVDFGPTAAMAEGRQPYLARETWKLFPDRFDDDGNPNGWVPGLIGDLFTLQRGFDLPANTRSPGNFEVMAASGPNGSHNEAMVLGPGVTTGRSGILGRVFLVLEDFWPLNTSLWVKEFKASSPLHAYFALQKLDLASLNAGSAVPTLNRNHVHNLPTVIPPLPVVQRFEELCSPMMRMKRDNEIQSKALAATRDFLLPKLLSGEIRVRDAEKIAEAAA